MGDDIQHFHEKEFAGVFPNFADRIVKKVPSVTLIIFDNCLIVIDTVYRRAKFGVDCPFGFGDNIWSVNYTLKPVKKNVFLCFLKIPF